ncbi:MAG: heme-binding protein, partial [Phycisphaerae bacterium]|nr:heme-binding protein [Phycisphaerae bacterium]
GYRSGPSVVDESLPAGYPAPTPPGAIDLKSYPSVRRAQIATERGGGTNGAFFPLFRHISSRDIAMTTPVEVDLTGRGAPRPRAMSFLYRTADLGPVGRDGAIEVVDAAPVTVVSIGLRGSYGNPLIDRGLAELNAWLDENDDWARDGDPRALYYNGPMVRDRNKWAEVQIPVRFVGTSDPNASNEPAHAATEASGASVSSFIALAVERGVSFYNAGQPAACVAVYEVAIRGLLALPELHLDSNTRRVLQDALQAVEDGDDPRITAWTLRRALDAASQTVASS